MPKEEQAASSAGEANITASYIVKYVIPILLIVVSGVAWGARLESRAEMNHAAILELKATTAADNKMLDAMKVEQARLNGQIETLRVMIQTLSETAKRIEDKLDK